MGVNPDRGTSSAIDLSPQHLRVVCDLLGTHLPGVAVWAYGSRVRGNARQYSDLDLVAFTGPEHATRFDILREAFEESDLLFRVDLFAWFETPCSFRSQIRQNYAVLQHGGE
jgi:predicted nucleotidyltransferase